MVGWIQGKVPIGRLDKRQGAQRLAEWVPEGGEGEYFFSVFQSAFFIILYLV